MSYQWRVEGTIDPDPGISVAWGDLQGAPPVRLGDEDPVGAAKAAVDILVGDLAVELPGAVTISGTPAAVTIVLRSLKAVGP